MENTPNRPIVMVTSVPKSGTHLLIPILEKLDFTNTNCFVVNNSLVLKEKSKKFSSHRKAGFYFMKGHPYYYENTIDIKFDAFVKLCSPGDFFLSHMTPRGFPFYLLSSIKIVFIKRDLSKTFLSDFKTEMLISKMNNNKAFLQENNMAFIGTLAENLQGVRQKENVQEQFYQFLNNMFKTRRPHLLDLLYWKFYKNVFFINYEDLVNEAVNRSHLVDLAKFLEVDITEEEASHILTTALNSETPTKIPQDLAEKTTEAVWDRKCQRIYEGAMMHQIQDELNQLKG